MTDESLILFSILEKITKIQQSKKKALVVFDLDSTLFDVSPRSQQILKEFAQLPDAKQKYPLICTQLEMVEIKHSDWGISEAILRHGIDINHSDFLLQLMDYWKVCFFSNSYLQYDKPYAGAVDFAQEVAKRGAYISYLTGRDVHRMGIGTQEVLLRHQFPLDNQKYKIALKPHKDHDDAHFKKDWFNQIPIDEYEHIWFFENEPVNLHLIDEHFDHIDSIFFDSTHSRMKEPLPHLPRIQNYLWRS